MYSPSKASDVYTPQRGTRSARSTGRVGSAPGRLTARLTASTSKAKHQANRLELSEEQSASLVSGMETATAKTLRASMNFLRGQKSALVLEIQEGTQRFSKLEGAVAAADDEEDETFIEVLKEQLKQQKSYLHSKEMRLNLVNFKIGALSVEMLGEGIDFPEDKEFINFGTMMLEEAQAVFGGSSFASDIQAYVGEIMKATNEPENVVLYNILLQLKEGNHHKNHEFLDMFRQFTDDAKAVLGRKNRRAGRVWFSPAIRCAKEKLGFKSSTESMLWRITVYLDLDWNLDDTIFVPKELRNPFQDVDETFLL